MHPTACISGDDFCTSGRAFFGHCERHGFKALAVDFLAGITLNFGALVLSLLISALCVLCSMPNLNEASGFRSGILIGILVGIGSWLVASFILVFIASILLNIIDASYACLVLDLDHAAQVGTYRQPAMAQLVIAKANPTFVLVNPGGGPAQLAQVVVLPGSEMGVQPGVQPMPGSPGAVFVQPTASVQQAPQPVAVVPTAVPIGSPVNPQ